MDLRAEDIFAGAQIPRPGQQGPDELSQFIAKVNAAKQAQAMEQMKAAQIMALKKQEAADALALQREEMANRLKVAGIQAGARAGAGAIPADIAIEAIGEENAPKTWLPGSAISGAEFKVAMSGMKNRQLSPKGAEMVANLDSGIGAINVMREITGGPGGRLSRTRAALGGAPLIGGLITAGSKDSQDLRNAAAEAADVLTRARTGAALNQREQETYGNLFLNVLDTPEAMERALSRYEKLFQDTKAGIQAGRTHVPQQRKAEFLRGLEDELRSEARKVGAPAKQQGQPAGDAWKQDPDIQAVARQVSSGALSPEAASLQFKSIRSKKGI